MSPQSGTRAFRHLCTQMVYFFRCIMIFVVNLINLFSCRGGLQLHITGTNLDTIQNPKMFFVYPSQNGTSITSAVQVRANSWHIIDNMLIFVHVFSVCRTLFVRKKKNFKCIIIQACCKCSMPEVICRFLQTLE